MSLVVKLFFLFEEIFKKRGSLLFISNASTDLRLDIYKFIFFLTIGRRGIYLSLLPFPIILI